VWEITWLPAPARWLQWLPETGFIGVHLFFFLSGFVIVYPFVRAQFHHEPLPRWNHFLWRRFIKIVPSYVLSIAVAFAIGYAATENSGAPVWAEVLTHLLFIHTWWMTTYGSINGVLWTLAVEVEFYMIFPLVWWCFRRQAWFTGGVMIVAALLWRVHANNCCFSTTMPLLVENLPGYLDIFACGMLSAWTFVRYGKRIRESSLTWIAPVAGCGGLVLLARLMMDLYGHRMEPQWQLAPQIVARPLFGIAFGLTALGFLGAPPLLRVLIDNAPLRFFGLISYNLYLYHQLIAREMLRFHLPPYHRDPHYDPAWQWKYTLAAFAVTIAQATLVTYLIERPLLRVREPRLLRDASGHST
jgi:peptidoglycan/LPS O-acetylase OafA/YrhL